MVNLSKAQITGIVSLALILTGAVVVENIEKSYYCASEDNVKECLRVSSSGITCYYLGAEDLTKGDRCTGGTWEPINNYYISNSGFSGSGVITLSDDCLKDGEWCYCNPRGLIKNKRRCSELE